MSWDKGFNFRATSGYVTDGANTTYVLKTDTYPTTRNTVTFGYDANFQDGRDRSTGGDVRLAGLNFVSNSTGASVTRFRIDLPAAGDYKINLAAGDQAAEQTAFIEFGDNTTYTTLVTGTVIAANSFLDAGGTTRTAANWPSLNTQITKTFASTIFNVRIGGLGGGGENTPLAHLFVSQVPPVGGVAISSMDGNFQDIRGGFAYCPNRKFFIPEKL